MKSALGILMAFALGFGCRYFGIPSPAPPALTGALLVLAMTLGYTVTDRIVAARTRRSTTGDQPGGSST